MKSYAAAALLLASTAISHPIEKRADITDLDILQYALTLEHLENVFYKGGVSTMSQDMFVAAGFSAKYYTNLLYVVNDEQDHVQYLTDAIKSTGATPVAACEYNFPYKDPMSFVALASVLEGVGTSAYLGGAGLIQSKDYLGVAGSILVTESIHTSLQRFNLGEIAAANPYGTALGLNQVFTIAGAFIKSCPASNPTLPLKAFPGLTATQGNPTSQGIPFTFQAKGTVPASAFVTFVSGLNTTSVPVTMKGNMISAMIPNTIAGQSYAFITSSAIAAGMSVTDNMVLFGPAVIEVTPPSPMFDIKEQ
ncbi:hypothetical protein N7G274_002779 [Stereocaulon virgatum]|uniref:Uncharacterized protein n=1 Tax=Stereocaulon virgatum TaxID=373712 RepID=A0ABR4AJY4_9LECA